MLPGGRNAITCIHIVRQYCFRDNLASLECHYFKRIIKHTKMSTV